MIPGFFTGDKMVFARFLLLACIAYVFIGMPLAYIKRKREITRQEEIWDVPVDRQTETCRAVLLEKNSKLIKTRQIYMTEEETAAVEKAAEFSAVLPRRQGRIMIYTAIFLLEGGQKAEHQLPRFVWEELSPGMKGLLVTENDAFSDFIPD